MGSSNKKTRGRTKPSWSGQSQKNQKTYWHEQEHYCYYDHECSPFQNKPKKDQEQDRAFRNYRGAILSYFCKWNLYFGPSLTSREMTRFLCNSRSLPRPTRFSSFSKLACIFPVCTFRCSNPGFSLCIYTDLLDPANRTVLAPQECQTQYSSDNLSSLPLLHDCIIGPQVSPLCSVASRRTYFNLIPES
jgi:hypothetical protein